MSRIYEALKRAELEKHALTEPQQGPFEDLLGGSTLNEPLPNKLYLDPDDIKGFEWEPNLRFLPSLDEQGEAAEQFRRLRSQVYLLRFEGKLKTVLVSSGMPEEGKSFVASNLALSLARSRECRVLLIDGDLRRPSLHRLFGAPQSPGLAEYLAEAATAATVMQRCQSRPEEEDQASRVPPNLTFIPSGDCGPRPPEITGNYRFQELVAMVSPHFDWIIVDSPPVLAVADTVDLARAADGVLLVARAGITPFDVAQRAQAALRKSRLLGFVLNAARKPSRRDSYYPYYSAKEADKARRHRKD